MKPITPLLAGLIVAATPAVVVGAVGDDTPIEPITASVIEVAIAIDTDICDSVRTAADAARNLEDLYGADGFSEAVIPALVAYAKDSFEDAWGPDAAMTREAEEVFEDWMTQCAR